MSQGWKLVASGAIWYIPTYITAYYLGVEITWSVFALLCLVSIYDKICDRIMGVK